MSDAYQTVPKTPAEMRADALLSIQSFLKVSPNTLKQGLSGEEFARELAKGAELLLKYVDQGIIP
jgi:hypothetical protein